LALCSIKKLCSHDAFEANIIPGDEVSSGCYLTGDGRGVKPREKCTHGVLNDNGAYGIKGINKDREWPLYAPHYFYHKKAAELSMKATQTYLQQLSQSYSDVVIDGTHYTQRALTERELKLLFGIGSSTLVFVIDTTGNMGDTISSVQDTAVKIVKSLQGTNAEPTSHVLMGCNNPVGTNLITGADANAFTI
jgi:hypothetical protein